MNIKWSRQALAEFGQIKSHISKDSFQAAQKMMGRIIQAVDISLRNQPLIGRPGRVEGTRELVVHSTYIIAYCIRSETINILSIRHTSRQWPERFQ